MPRPAAIREVGKAMGLSGDLTGKLARASWRSGHEGTLADLAAAEGLDPAGDPRLAIALAEEIQDLPRHVATHVGAFVVPRGLTDRSDLLDGLGQVDGAEAGWDRLPGRADEVRRPDPGSRRPVRMLPSRNFR